MPLDFIPAIHRLTHRIGLSLGPAHGLEVTQGEAHILAHLAGAGDSSIADLHAAFAHRRSTLTSILDRLAARGLITRQLSPTDRRSFIIRLTRRGKSLALRVLGHLEGIEQKMSEGWTRAERAQFAGLLAQAEHGLDRKSGRIRNPR